MVKTGGFSISLFMMLLTLSVTFGLDASINFYGADKFYYRFFQEPSTGRFQYDVNISGDVASNLNLAFSLWSSHKIILLRGGFSLPEELDYNLSLSYYDPAFSAGISGNIYTAKAGSYEIGGYFDYYVPTGLDMLSLMLEVSAYSDLKGFYEELKVVPELILPLSMVVDITFPITLGFMENNFNNYSVNGPTGMSFSPRVSLIINDSLSCAVSGGYFLGLNNSFSSYPFIMLKIGFKFSSAG